MIQQGVDFGFVGPSYEAPMLLQDAQRLINWYCEIAEDKGAKMPIALLGCPGLNPILSTSVGPVRGAWVLPGGTQALVVTGSTVWLITANPLAAKQVGTLLTSTGYVCIRDNGPAFGGQGGYAVLVDGFYGYYYALSGQSANISFTGTTTSGSNAVAVSAIPNGLVVTPGAIVSDGGAAIPVGATFAGTDFNGVNLLLSVPATANKSNDPITIFIPPFGQITDPAFLAASRVDFIEGWLIFNQVGTRTFFTNAATPYTLLFAGSFYSLKDSSTDNLETLYANNRELWLMGERTTEIWYNAGGASFAFSRIPAVAPQIGCAAPHSIARLGTDLVWLGKNEQGENIVVKNEGYSFQRISTHAIDHAISQYSVVSDAIGFAYEEEGHWFYVLTFPTADATWVYDGKTKLWHQRGSFNNGMYHRFRGNCYMDFNNMRVVGDYQTGQLHQMSRKFFTDAGAPLRCQRRAPHVWSKSNRKRLFHGWLQVEFTPGVGLQTGQGQLPMAMLRWSNDGGFKWSHEFWQTIGAAGRARTRAIWRRLGYARDRVYELNYSDPTPRDVVGVTLFFEGEEEAEDAA